MKQNMRKRTPLAVLLALCLAMQLCVPAAMASNRLMRAGDAAIAQIEEEEGFRAEKYSSGGKWYIGYGTECGAEDYPEGITREEAELLLMSKVEAYEAKLNDFFGRYDVTPTQGQFDALICFSYNFGTGWMSGTSDLVKIARGEKDATRLEVAHAFGEWCHSGGKAQAGGGLFRAVYSLGHDLNAYQAAAVGQHRKPNRAHAAVEIQQEIIRRQRGKFPRFGIQGFGGGGVDLVKFVHTHPKRDPGQRILDIPGAERHTGFSTQNHIGAGVVAVDENGR